MAIPSIRDIGICNLRNDVDYYLLQFIHLKCRSDSSRTEISFRPLNQKFSRGLLLMADTNSEGSPFDFKTTQSRFQKKLLEAQRHAAERQIELDLVRAPK